MTTFRCESCGYEMTELIDPNSIVWCGCRRSKKPMVKVEIEGAA